jgi:hypothetical protein
MRSRRYYMPAIALAVSSQKGFSNVESTDDLVKQQREYEANIGKKKYPSDCYPTIPEVNLFTSPYEKPYGKSFRHSFIGKAK